MRKCVLVKGFSNIKSYVYNEVVGIEVRYFYRIVFSFLLLRFFMGKYFIWKFLKLGLDEDILFIFLVDFWVKF